MICPLRRVMTPIQQRTGSRACIHPGPGDKAASSHSTQLLAVSPERPSISETRMRHSGRDTGNRGKSPDESGNVWGLERPVARHRRKRCSTSDRHRLSSTSPSRSCLPDRYPARLRSRECPDRTSAMSACRKLKAAWSSCALGCSCLLLGIETWHYGAPTLRLQRLLGLSDRYAGFLVIIPHLKVKSKISQNCFEFINRFATEIL